MSLSGCSDYIESDSVVPVLKEITLTPNPCKPGEDVTATVSYAKEGRYFFYVEQYYTVNDKKYTLKKGQFPADGTLTYKFKAPNTSGSFEVLFSAMVSLTSGTTLYDMTNEVSKTLVVKADEEE